MRGYFTANHPQSDSHMCRFRSNPVVNVLLGPTLPRPDRSDEERDRWCRAMLIIFRPWRTLVDLKCPGQTWTNTFESVKAEFTMEALETMRNMNIENECKEAKDSYEKLRR
ncbi:hypothetical protein B0H10DRAFT_1787667, partial [Mycena sp. CBHHK59/15]